MKRFLGLTALAVMLSLSACGGKDEAASVEKAAESALLEYVPADSPYVYGALEPSPDDVADKLETLIDAVMPAFKAQLDVVSEGLAMAEFVGVDEREFYQRYTKRKMGKWTLDEVKYQRNKYDCVFLERAANGRGKCSIYEVRPTQCRTWPFWASNLSDPRAWAQSAEGCPGMKLPDENGDSGGGQFVPIETIRIELAKNPDGL